MCKPERLALVSYIFEYAFLYDNVLESAAKATTALASRADEFQLDVNTDNLVLDETEYRTVRSTTGTKQIQSKMLLELLSVDATCANVVIEAWKEMVETTATHDKTCIFDNIEDYVDYRIIDTGAPFVDTVMRWGMGILLTKEEEKILAPITKPCFAALGLANDYYSFDIEWKEFQQADTSHEKSTITNAVWLFMNWQGLSIAEAKEKTRQVVRKYEKDFQSQMNEFVADKERCSPKLARYLKALAYQIPGNIAWSLRCPRYHPELYPDATERLESSMETKERSNGVLSTKEGLGAREAHEYDSEASASSRSSVGTPESRYSSASSVSSFDYTLGSPTSKGQIQLGDQHLLAPFDYMRSLPSKGVREALIDAMNVWLVLPERTVKVIKSIAQKLHSSSLLLDDIEDSSPLRRGQPAAHTIFGSPQTINCANYLLVCKLEDPQCTAILLEELRNLFIGQSFDLYWTRQGECPSEDEYLDMISQKTGGLFRLLARLMSQCAASTHKRAIPGDLMVHLGKYFQVRDDYMNRMSDEYTSGKGFCENLDEGKFSFPLVHAWHSNPSHLVLRGIIQERRFSGSLSVEHKKMILEHLHQAGSVKHTLHTLKRLESDINGNLEQAEKGNGCENWVMRLLVRKLLV
ncbi:uncharacterized protein N7459_010113 [Penicillium hispanicum]|uniref:uncharacterized protein n=1 Tax=Penicillium hispanicum TaxID=1080232 RepID=UPI0025426899|nr:uncharacterized protein N7459_010113 [Penicillium hispanicum]KAJ5566731.1 hypothetical protein N7459_010113 [Penicillium hispanicum]